MTASDILTYLSIAASVKKLLEGNDSLSVDDVVDKLKDDFSNIDLPDLKDVVSDVVSNLKEKLDDLHEKISDLKS